MNNVVFRERQAVIQTQYTEMEWRKKSEEVRKERRRRVQEWEKNHERVGKGVQKESCKTN